MAFENIPLERGVYVIKFDIGYESDDNYYPSRPPIKTVATAREARVYTFLEEAMRYMDRAIRDNRTGYQPRAIGGKVELWDFKSRHVSKLREWRWDGRNAAVMKD